MSLITLRGACFDFGRERILHEIDLALLPGVKYALVGANGAGKTTLLQILAGELGLHRGEGNRAGGLRVGYLRQERELGPAEPCGTTLHQAVLETAFGRELEIEAELDALAAAIAGADARRQQELVARQGSLQSEYERLDGYGARARLEAALSGLGLAPELWRRPVTTLSGGERRRAALAAVLLRPADLLLLDEPTNHLDLAACEWLEAHLRQHRGAAVLVSHDRRFLDEVAQRTLHLEDGRLVAYEGGWSRFERDRVRRQERQRIAWQRQQDEIRKEEELVRRTFASGGQKSRQAQARKKRLEKVERLEKIGGDLPPPRLSLSPERRSGQTVLEARGLTQAAGERTLFSALDLLVARGERIGIVGPNGCGKSTLLAILAGRLRPLAGRVVRGHNVDTGFYDQDIGGLTDGRAVLDELGSIDPLASVETLRGQLAAFGFGPETVDRPVGRLSGGERARLALLKLVKEGHNLLLLDEPTNHLDVGCREALEDALAAFEGTLVVVSHDRRFLDEIVGRLIVFTGAAEAGAPAAGAPAGVVLHEGNWSGWRRVREEAAARELAAQEAARAEARAEAARRNGGPGGAAGRAARSAASAPPPGQETVPPGALSKNEQARRRLWIEEAEAAIAELERERERRLAEVAAPETSPAGRREAAHRCEQIDGEIAARLAEWERWHEELQGNAE